MSETRRHALKMLGAISLTCAFPFETDELYAQHVMPEGLQTVPTGPYTPQFFSADEFASLARLTDAIIPPTTTAGAAAAGVPEYIDRVVTLNREQQPVLRRGLAWLDAEARRQYARPFVELDPSQHAALLQPLSDTVDRRRHEEIEKRLRRDPSGTLVYHVAITDRTTPASANGGSVASAPEDDAALAVRFFAVVKNLTADGYYTSRAGLVDELGYKGNTFRASFPACPEVPEH